MRSIDKVAATMKNLIAAHTKSYDVLEMTDEVANIFVKNSADMYEGIDPQTILYDEAARDELYRRMLIIKEDNGKSYREGCSKLYQLIFAWRFKQLDLATQEFIRIVTVIYERSN